jgi:hypothetical protein
MPGVANELRKAAGQHNASWAWASTYAARGDKFTVRIASQDLFASCEDVGFEKPECLGLHASLFLTLGSSHAIDQVNAAIRSQPVVRPLWRCPAILRLQQRSRVLKLIVQVYFFDTSAVGWRISFCTRQLSSSAT